MRKLVDVKFETDNKSGTQYVTINGKIVCDNEPACKHDISELNKTCKGQKVNMFGYKGSAENVSIEHNDGKKRAFFKLKIRLYDE